MSATARTASRRPAAKVIGSLGVLAATAAIAGLGTYGAFTDSTASLESNVATGTVSIDLAAPASSIEFPDVAGGWNPGDRGFLPLDLVNTGSSDLSSVTLAVTAPVSSKLVTDTTNGLQISIDSCDQAWATDGGHYSCPGTLTHHHSGPVVLAEQLAGLESLSAGGRDHLLATVTLPQSADNSFMGARSVLAFSFTGTQRTGTDR